MIICKRSGGGPSGKLQSKTDAKGIQTEFSYDSYKRVLQERKRSGIPLEEDRCQRVEYFYDEGPGGAGRLTRTRWGWNLNAQDQLEPSVGPASLASKIGFEEKFEYTAAGRILSKWPAYYSKPRYWGCGKALCQQD